MSIFARETQASSCAAINVSAADWVPTAVARALWTGTGGTIVLRLAHDTVDVTFTNVPAGAWLPFSVLLIRSAGTTATGLVALY